MAAMKDLIFRMNSIPRGPRLVKVRHVRQWLDSGWTGDAGAILFVESPNPGRDHKVKRSCPWNRKMVGRVKAPVSGKILESMASGMGKRHGEQGPIGRVADKA